MNFPVSTPAQLQAILRAMRTSRGLSQAELGRQVGVSQRRIAAIEAAPGRASFDQLARIVATLGGQLSVVEQMTTAKERNSKLKAAKKPSRLEKADW
ncbi:MAG: helix-turn-helix domain-containing protein [Nibricoccus sp.]